MTQTVRVMRESDTYLASMDEGRVEQIKEDILILCEDRFGSVGESVKTALAAIDDLDRLRAVFRRLLEAPGWKEIFDTP
jgi:hypothetical protein